MNHKTTILSAVVLGIAIFGIAKADPIRDTIIAGFATQAGVSSFSAEDGKAFFQGTHTGGKPETPSCASCHTDSPFTAGKTRVGKVIEPMAISATPERFTDSDKVAKWFRRNCNSVLGRECSALEKGNVLTYLSSF